MASILTFLFSSRALDDGCKKAIAFLSMVALLSCESDLQIGTTVNIDCSRHTELDICKANLGIQEDKKFLLLTKHSKADISWDAVDKARSCNFKLSKTIDCSDTPIVTYTVEEPSTIVNLEKDGIYYACIESLLPGAKNLPEATYLFKVIRDTKVPKISLAKGLGKPFNLAFTLGTVAEDLTELSFKWEKLSGPGNVTFSSATAQDPEISASADGDYKLAVTITDELGFKATKTYSFNWDQTKPTAPPTLIPSLRLVLLSPTALHRFLTRQTVVMT